MHFGQSGPGVRQQRGMERGIPEHLRPGQPLHELPGRRRARRAEHVLLVQSPAGATAIIVVNEVSANVGCATYTLRINPCGSGTALTATPTHPGLPTRERLAPATSTPTYTPTVVVPTLTPSSTPPEGNPTSTSTSTATQSIATVTTTPVTGPTNTSTPCAINFSDVHTDDYFYDPVRYLYCHGVISGYADNTFRPGNLTTRGQLAKIVVLAIGWATYTPPSPTFLMCPPRIPSMPTSRRPTAMG